MSPQFPMFKLVMLLARQVSSPVAAWIKSYATANEWFRRHVCMPVGRGYHVYQLRVRLWALSLDQPRVSPAISDRVALESGATLLGESIVFGLGALTIFCEFNRQGNYQEYKELIAQAEWVAILMQLEELQREVDLQQRDIDRLLMTLRTFAPSMYPSPASDTNPRAGPAPADHSAGHHIRLANRVD